MSWVKVCRIGDLTPDVGVAALVNGQQVALFYVPSLSPALYVLDNWDPLGQAFVLSRGIVGDVQGEPCVASPLYKQHFSLKDGRCLEDADTGVRSWPVKEEKGEIWVQALS